MAAGDADVIIIDMPPNHSGLQYLGLPDTLSVPLMDWAMWKNKARKLVGKPDPGSDAVARIKDIVINETQYTAGQIKIMEAD